jgi:hypothetical protein
MMVAQQAWTANLEAGQIVSFLTKCKRARGLSSRTEVDFLDGNFLRTIGPGVVTTEASGVRDVNAEATENRETILE